MTKVTKTNRITALPHWVPEFLEAFVETGDVVCAAQKVNRTRSAIYTLRRRSAEFREFYERAKKIHAQAVSDRSRSFLEAPGT